MNEHSDGFFCNQGKGSHRTGSPVGRGYRLHLACQQQSGANWASLNRDLPGRIVETDMPLRAAPLRLQPAWTKSLEAASRRFGHKALRPLYQLYEARLVRQIGQQPVPRHVGIILDGNRRYAVRQGLAPGRDAYQIGARKLDEVMTWCVELGVPALTLWAFSTDNFARPSEQVEGILAAIELKMMEFVTDPHVHARGIRVKAIGRIGQLPESLRASIRAAEAATARYNGMQLSLAIAYGGREEITDSVRAILLQAAAEGKTLGEAANLV